MKFKTYAQQSRTDHRRKNKRVGKKQARLRGEINNKQFNKFNRKVIA